MIQRVQTLYLIVAIAALITLTLGIEVYSYAIVKEQTTHLDVYVNSYGIQIDGTIDATAASSDVASLQVFLNTQEELSEVKGVAYNKFPFFSITLFLTMLTIATLLTFKKLPTQLRFGRMAFFFSLLATIFTIVFYYVLKSEFSDVVENGEVASYLGLGFFCLIISTAFIFLANIGIKRDLDLIKSIDRIR